MTLFRKSLIGLTLVLGSSMAAAGQDVKAKITANLQALDKNVKVEKVEESPVKGVYAVTLAGNQIIYSNVDGNYIFRGDLLKLDGKKVTNLTAKERNKEVAKLLKDFPDEKMVVFSPKGKKKAHITVFTDVDCGFCRKLHKEVPQLNEMGIEVRYMAFPRGGEQSPAFATMQSVWCSKDRQQAMTKAKNGEKITADKCDNPVLEEFKLGVQLGVNGTPALFLADGTMIPGYRPADQLAKLLGVNK
ncbi:DsbC family protein [Zooshikella harenae]|uniref:Thiol:disulfide interchange protein n=1 Tax=Zooshikella harenae TaxID=2827238 RepID=A0ABS5Z6Q0_9GAMM|nr:DsbC family protein [Zooshikella harenae]MBU2709675.1 DsbC family protein [Zooshikella harenae]